MKHEKHPGQNEPFAPSAYPAAAGETGSSSSHHGGAGHFGHAPHEGRAHAEPRSSEQIESDIRRTRGRMDATLDELGHRLSARYFMNSLFDWWEAPKSGSRRNAAAMSAYRSVAKQVKAHPMPSLLIGAGLAWLIRESTTHEEDELEEFGIEEDEIITAADAPGARGVSMRSSDDLYANEDEEFGFASSTGGATVERPGMAEKLKEGVGEAKDKLGAAGEAAKHAAQNLKRKLGSGTRKSKNQLRALKESGREAADEVSQRAQDLYERSRSMTHKVGEQIEERYHTGARKVDQAMHEYPLAVGLGFAALGALIGVLLPRTRREDEWLGEKSDQLSDVTREKSGELLERGKAVAQRVGEAVKDEAREQGLSPSDVGQAFSGLTEKASRLAARAKEEASQAAMEQGLTPSQLQSEAQRPLPESRNEQRGG
jgi:ElaB/YqjD/DUF883 family membrane-anchored ribosome-binding protein